MATVLKTGAVAVEGGKEMLVAPPERFVNGVTWALAPDWLTVSQACELAGYDRGFMLRVIEAGGVDLDSITLDLCQRYADEIMLVTEAEIEASIRLLFEQHRLVVEGSGALSVSGLLKRKDQFKGKKVVAVICGRTIPLELFKRIIA